MDSLSAFKILQPTDISSGSDALIMIQVSDNIGAVNRIVYSIYAKRPEDGGFDWHSLADVSYQNPGNELRFFSVWFDSTEYDSSQAVQLKVCMNVGDCGLE